ncbi:MAG: glutamate--tRNA ligase [Candidatus Aenigmarchaeota archaeon]|nr:glutamate--tRNA ligase [Candidatus Aenigmarchaeota archaeon]
MEELIRKHALINASEYNGKANTQAVLSKVLAEKPELKKEIAKVGKTVSQIVKEVNSWPLEKQQEELAKFGKIEKPKKEEREGLPELPNAVMGKVVTRFAPEPNGYLHLGHLKSAFLSYLYAKKYDGKAFLRFDDTNPVKEKKEYYDAIREDLKTFELKFEKKVLESDYMEKFYEYAKDLFEQGHFYVCTCPQEKIKESRAKAKACPCRKRSVEENLKLWESMLKDAKQGSMIVRLKTDPAHRNPAMREPSMLRIIDAAHPLKGNKYRVYPMYNFACTVMDHELEVTHVMRDKGFENDAKVQEFIYKIFKWKIPENIQFGRLKTVAGIPMKKRKLIEMIKAGELSGFEDIRIPTPRNLIKKGFRPDTIKRLIEEIGPSKNDVNISFDKLEKYNRQLIDSISNRYFFVKEPVEIKLDKVLEKFVKAPLLPDKEDMRSIPVSDRIFVEKEDYDQNKGEEVRLMHLCNVILDKKAKVTGTELKDVPKLHWVSDNVKIRIIMADGKEVKGLAEPEVDVVKPNQTVQFERVGFARCERKGLFYFAHK